MITTQSLCPVCLKDIPAVITISDTVLIHKLCDEHGDFTGMIERDPQWWLACQRLNCQNIYDGYMLDVTDKCNIKCKYCYHGNGANDKDIDSIVTDAWLNKALAPIILTGGEPTLHPELPKIIRQCSSFAETWILTNGIKMGDEEYLNELIESGLIHSDWLLVGLSFHKESNGADLKLVELCRKKNLKLPTTFWVIDELSQIDEALETFEANKDVILSMRIKAASNLWAEQNANNKIFVSDMLAYINNKGPIEIVTDGRNNKTSFANIMYGDLFVMLISWYDKYNIDLNDINCPPYYKANDGNIYDLVKSCILNECN